MFMESAPVRGRAVEHNFCWGVGGVGWGGGGDDVRVLLLLLLLLLL